MSSWRQVWQLNASLVSNDEEFDVCSDDWCDNLMPPRLRLTPLMASRDEPTAAVDTKD